MPIAAKHTSIAASRAPSRSRIGGSVVPFRARDLPGATRGRAGTDVPVR